MKRKLLYRLTWGLLLLGGLFFLILQVVFISQKPVTDFCQDYQAARYVLQGLSPYLPVHCGSAYGRLPAPVEYDAHPPFSVLLVLPLGLLPKLSASLLWGLVCLASYLAAGWLLLKELGWRSLGGIALFVAGSAVFPSFIDAEKIQNFGQILTLLLVAAWVLERRGHATWAGALIGLAGLLKIWPAALLLGALLLRRWPLVRSGAVTLVAGSLLALLVLGPSANLAYLGPVQANEQYWVPSEVNLSVVGVVVRPLAGYHGPTNPSYVIPSLVQGFSLAGAVLLGEIVALAFLMGTLVFLWWQRKQQMSEAGQLLSYGLLVTVMLLVFPTTWYWSMITLLLPGATLFLALRRIHRPPTWWWLALEASLLMPFGLDFPIGWAAGTLLHTYPAGFFTGWIALLFDLPTIGVLVFSGLQAWLLWQAGTRRRGANTPKQADPSLETVRAGA